MIRVFWKNLLVIIIIILLVNRFSFELILLIFPVSDHFFVQQGWSLTRELTVCHTVLKNNHINCLILGQFPSL